MDVVERAGTALRRPGTGGSRLPEVGRGGPLVAAVGAVTVVVVWWRGAAPAVGAGAHLIDAGRLTGLLAGYVALVQLVLRARLGVIERWLGTDAINRAHRLLGGYLVGLVVAHLVLVTMGYARAGHSSVPDQIVSLLRDYPYVLWAVIAAGLLFVVSCSSLPPLRCRLPYEVWHGLHLLVYVALALAFFHQIANGEHLRHSGWVRTAWTASWIGATVLLVAVRWLRPGWLALRHRLVVTGVRRETADTVSVYVSGRRMDRFPALPGQYFRWRFVTGRRWYAAHPYSLSAEPDGRRLRFTASVTGRHSSALPDLAPGTRVVAEGPCGGLIVAPRWMGPVVLIAGGLGVAPLRAIFATCHGTSLTLVYRAHSPDRMPLRHELDDLAAHRGAQLHYIVGPRDDTKNQLTADRLVVLCPYIRAAMVYVCGSASFVQHVARSVSELGVPARRVRTESFELK